MNELEQRLVALGDALDFPPAPNLAPAVLARLPARSRPRRVPRRALAVALASALLLAAGALAAPPTRSVILRILGLRGVVIERVPRLPTVPVGRRLGLGEPIALHRARHAASFTAVLPAGRALAFLGHDIPGGRISFVVGPVLIMEFRGSTLPFIFKVLGPGTRLENVRVNGNSGVYLSGAPHQVLFQTQAGQVQIDRVRLAGNVLLFARGRLTVRIEGTRSLRQALAIARSLH